MTETVKNRSQGRQPLGNLLNSCGVQRRSVRYAGCWTPPPAACQTPPFETRRDRTSTERKMATASRDPQSEGDESSCARVASTSLRRRRAGSSTRPGWAGRGLPPGVYSECWWWDTWSGSDRSGALCGGARDSISVPGCRHPCIPKPSLQGQHTRVHSASTFFRPRKLNRRNPITSLIQPTGAWIAPPYRRASAAGYRAA